MLTKQTQLKSNFASYNFHEISFECIQELKK